MALVGAALRRPAAAALVDRRDRARALPIPAVGLKTGPPSQAQLSRDDPTREDFELIEREIGPGFDAPFVIVAATDDGTVTEPARLRALSRWQHRIARQPGVQAVVGPGQVATRGRAAAQKPAACSPPAPKPGPLAELGRLGRNLGRAAAGVAQLRAGARQGELRRRAAGRGVGPGRGRRPGDRRRPRPGDRGQRPGGRRAADLRPRDAPPRRCPAPGRARRALNLKFGLQSLAPNLRHNALRRSRRQRKSLEHDAHTKLPQLIAAGAGSRSAAEGGAARSSKR